MRVLQLWRYPVKSLQGEQLSVTDVGERGLVGDRAWGLLDRATGLTLTARRVPELLFAHGMLQRDGAALVRLPDGTETADDEELSRWLGRDVALTAATPDTAGTYEIALDAEHEEDSPWVQWSGPTGSFHDSTRTQVSILGEGTVGHWPVRRFRANVIVGGSAEDGFVGRRLRGVDDLTLEVVKQIDRCVVVTRAQSDGIERDLDVLRSINRDRATFLGVGALVRRVGRLAVGDDLRDEEDST